MMKAMFIVPSNPYWLVIKDSMKSDCSIKLMKYECEAVLEHLKFSLTSRAVS